MPSTDPRVDAYIRQAEPFARPILMHLRKVVHQACPDVGETIKWGFPHFEHRGVLCSMAAFRRHATFGFWKGSLLAGHGLPKTDEKAMGQFGRITSLGDLPSDRVLARLVKAAVALNGSGTKVARPARAKKAPLRTPHDLMNALRANRAALATFETFTPGHRREYVEWVVSAKRAPTRERRIAQAVRWMAEGRTQNWKYARARYNRAVPV